MTVRNGHGNGRGVPRVEVLPANEQPVGVPDPTGGQRPAVPAVQRRSDGTFTPEGAATLGVLGGRARAARARRLRALEGLGLRGAVPDALRPYLDDADEFATHEVDRLARDCGGGVCPPNASALVQQAALAMAGSRAAYATGDVTTGARLGAEVRSCLLGARELCVREAQSRANSASERDLPWFRPEGGKP